MDPKQIKFLTFEGGGGKAIVYLGAVRVLEEVLKILPLSERPATEDPSPIEGMAGTSGGAITSLFLAAGMNANDIKERTQKDPYDNFYDEPSMGYYKAVVFDGEKNSSGYASDTYVPGNQVDYDIQAFSDDQFLTFDDLNARVGKVSKGIKQVISDGELFFEHLTDAESHAIAESKNVRKKLPYTFLGKAIRFQMKFGIRKAAKPGDSPPVIKISGRTDKKKKGFRKRIKSYIDSLFYDRGLFSGVAVRQYFWGIMLKYMEEKHNYTIPIDPTDLPELKEDLSWVYSTLGLEGTDKKILDAKISFIKSMTFKTFEDDVIKNRFKVKIVSTNVTTNRPMEFSREKTPDFPLVDAVSMSMSIPGAFKPTLVNAIVDFSRKDTGKDSDEEYLRSYQGFYVDGGATNNLAIHLFDEVIYVNRHDLHVNGIKTPGTYPLSTGLKEGMYGIRSQGGVDRSYYFGETGHLKDDLYREYIKKRVNSDIDEIKKIINDTSPLEGDRFAIQKLLNQKKPVFLDDKTNIDYIQEYLIYSLNVEASYSILGDYAGALYNTVSFYTEEGQIRNEEEAKQTIALHSYDVGLFDFDLGKQSYLRFLSAFTQRTAAMKIARELGITKEYSYADLFRKSQASIPNPKNPEETLLAILFANYDISKVS